jgi:hypothetical protein
VPLSATGTGFIPPAFLAQQTAAVAAKCGASGAPALLGVSGTYNVGALEARGVDNLFGQYADIRGLRYEGVPLALNQYAAPSAYLPYTGAAATERFGLPYRRLFVTYELRLR